MGNSNNILDEMVHRRRRPTHGPLQCLSVYTAQSTTTLLLAMLYCGFCRVLYDYEKCTVYFKAAWPMALMWGRRRLGICQSSYGCFLAKVRKVLLSLSRSGRTLNVLDCVSHYGAQIICLGVCQCM